jgi:carboxyl-terminal processing protease
MGAKMKKLILSVMLAFSAFNATAQISSPPQDVLSAYRKIAENYVDPVDEKIMAPGSVKGMVALLDAHSDFFDSAELRATRTAFGGGSGGTGVGLVPENGQFRVSVPFKTSPALDAGVKRRDVVIAIDGKKLDGLSQAEAFNLMSGAPGSRVTLTVMRDGQSTPIDYTVTRAVVSFKTITASEFVKPGVAYIKIKGFGAETGADFASELKKLDSEAPIKSVILDLRGNPGGLMNSAVGVAAAFLPDGSLIAYTKGRSADSNKQITASSENYLRSASEIDYIKNLPASIKNVPLVVLINGDSASASELVAGALQAHHRATIIGTPSYGKGSGQKLVKLDDGSALKITYFRYFLPDNRSIQAVGVVPDLLVNDGKIFTREVNIDRHLSSTVGISQQQAAVLPKSVENSSSADAQMERAIAFLNK